MARVHRRFKPGAYHIIIAGAFPVAMEQTDGSPDQGIKPENSGHNSGDELEQVIVAEDMG
jgi:hypothetical protein